MLNRKRERNYIQTQLETELRALHTLTHTKTMSLWWGAHGLSTRLDAPPLFRSDTQSNTELPKCKPATL